MSFTLANNPPTITLHTAVATTPATGTVETWSVDIAAPTSVQQALPTIVAGAPMPCFMTATGEIIYVTAGITTTGTQSWTVQRAMEGSPVAAAALNAVVQPRATAASVAQTGAGVNKVQLNYTESTNLLSAAAATTNAWTNIGSAQAFTVDDPQSSIDVNAVLALLFQGTGASVDGVGAIIIDGTTRYILGPSISSDAGQFSYVKGGSLNIGSLSAGSHTVQAQYYIDGPATIYLRASSNPNTEMLRLQVIERKVVATGASGILDYIKLTNTATQALGGTDIAVNWDSEVVPPQNAAMHSTSTNPQNVVVQTPGRYLCVFTYAFTYSGGAGTIDVYGRLRKNGAVVRSARDNHTFGATLAQVAAFIDCASGDVLTAAMAQDSGGGAEVIPTGCGLEIMRVDGYAVNPMTTLNDMLRGTTGGVPERVASTGVQGSIWTTDSTGKPGWNGLLSANAKLSADIALTTANQVYDGPSLALAIGTWLVVATISLYLPGSSSGWASARLWDGSTTYDSTAAYQATAGGGLSFTLTAIITLTSAGTIKASAVSVPGGSGLMTAASIVNGVGNNASQISAIKVA